MCVAHEELLRLQALERTGHETRAALEQVGVRFEEQV